MPAPTTPILVPAAARRLASQLQLLEGALLQTLVRRAAAWKVQADRKHEDLIRRAGAGAHQLRRAVRAWDAVLPVLHQAIQAAHERLDAQPATAVIVTQATARSGKRRVAATQQPAPAKPLSALDAAAQVLREAGEPMNAHDLLARILERGLWTTAGKTPAATIYAAMIREISAKGSSSRFQKVDRGRFATAC